MKKFLTTVFLIVGLAMLLGGLIVTLYEGASAGGWAFSIAGAILAGSGLLSMRD